MGASEKRAYTRVEGKGVSMRYVNVRAYDRFRFGRWEYVRAHFRRWPRWLQLVLRFAA